MSPKIELITALACGDKVRFDMQPYDPNEGSD